MTEYIKQVGIFLIIGQTILHFCPKEKYEKYVRLLLGFMIVAQLAKPVYTIGSSIFKNNGDYGASEKAFVEKLEESLSAIEEEWFVYEEKIIGKIEKEQTVSEDNKINEVEPVKIEVKLHE